MKKFGFTLAEVLVALGIIGVVAAITMPTFTASTQNAKIGPSLATAVANFEQANQALLQENRVERLSDLMSSPGEEYPYLIENFMKISKSGSSTEPILMTKSGTTYKISFAPAIALQRANSSIIIGNNPVPHREFYGMVTIDLNGSAKPNSNGVDQFIFGLFEDGSLRPKGGHQPWNNTDNNFWNTKCPANAEPVDASYCAGHIFENNLKVLYQ